MNNEIDLKGEINFVIMYSKIKKDLKNLFRVEKFIWR
jgi:hypothetical protein